MVILEPTTPNNQTLLARVKRKVTGAALETSDPNSLLSLKKVLLNALANNDAESLEGLFRNLNTNKQRHLFLQDKGNLKAIENFMTGTEVDQVSAKIVLDVLKDYVQYDSALLGTQADPRYQSLEALISFLKDDSIENTEKLALKLGYTYTAKNDETVSISTEFAQDQTKNFFKNLGSSNDRVLNLIYTISENSSLKERMGLVEDSLFNDIESASKIFKDGSAKLEALQEHVLTKYKNTHNLINSRKTKKIQAVTIDKTKAARFFPNTKAADLDEVLEDKFGKVEAGKWQVFNYSRFLEKLVNPNFESRKEAIESIFNAYDILENDKLEAAKINDHKTYKALTKQQNDLLAILKDEGILGTQGVDLVERTLTDEKQLGKLLPRILVTFTGILNSSSQASVSKLVEVYEKEKARSFGITDSLIHVRSIEDLDKEIKAREESFSSKVDTEGKDLLTIAGITLPQLKEVKELKKAFEAFHKKTTNLTKEFTNDNYENIIRDQLGTRALNYVRSEIANLGDLENPGTMAKSILYKHQYIEFIRTHANEINNLSNSNNPVTNGDIQNFREIVDTLDFSYDDQGKINNGKITEAFNALLNFDRTSGNELLKSLDSDSFASAFTVNSLSGNSGIKLIRSILDNDSLTRATKQGNSESILLSMLQDNTENSLTTRTVGLNLLIAKIDSQGTHQEKIEAKAYLASILKDHNSVSARDFIDEISTSTINYVQLVQSKDLISWLSHNRDELLTRLVPAVNSEFADLLGKIFPVDKANLIEQVVTPIAAKIADLALDINFKDGVTEEQHTHLQSLGIKASSISQLEKAYEATGDFDANSLFMYNEHSEDFNLMSLVKQFIKSMEQFFNKIKMDA